MCDYCYDEYMEAEDYYDPSSMSGAYGSAEQQSSSLDPLQKKKNGGVLQ